MKKSKFTEEQIAYALRQAEAGTRQPMSWGEIEQTMREATTDVSGLASKRIGVIEISPRGIAQPVAWT